MNHKLLMLAAKSLPHEKIYELFELAYEAYKKNPNPQSFLTMSEAFTVLVYKQSHEDGVSTQLIEEVKLRQALSETYKGHGTINPN